MILAKDYQDPKNEIWSELEWQPSLDQIEQFIMLQSLLRTWNKKVNLTRLIEGSDFWISQILDSLWPLKQELNTKQRSLEIIDVGTGCGLPGLALAIALPKSTVTLVDSIHKKTTAVESIIRTIGLTSRVNVRTERIEHTGQNVTFRGKFNFAVARAVAKAPILAEYLIPLLRPTGEAILYKGQFVGSEHQALTKALIALKAKISNIENFHLPRNQGVRHAIRITSIEQCPEIYPRSEGIPSKNPLNN